MGYDTNGTPKLPELNRDLRAELPDHGTKFNDLKRGFLKILADISSSFVSGFIRSDGTLDRDVVDDLSDLLEYLQDNRVGIFPDHLLNDIEVMSDITVDQNVTSQATYTSTVPAGKARVYIVASVKNGTRAFSPVMGITPSGGSLANVAKYTAATATRISNMVGGDHWAVMGPMILGPGDACVLDDDSFVAGDSMAHTFVYVEVTL